MRTISLLVVIAALLATVSATSVSGPTKLVSGSALPSSTQRFLRIRDADSVGNEDEVDSTEERSAREVVTKLTKQLSAKLAPKLKKLKALTDKELKQELLYLSGASHAKLYKNKVDPSVIYKRLDLHELVKSLSKADLDVNPVYKKWADYFNYWVDRNTGKIAGRM